MAQLRRGFLCNEPLWKGMSLEQSGKQELRDWPPAANYLLIVEKTQILCNFMEFSLFGGFILHGMSNSQFKKKIEKKFRTSMEYKVCPEHF